MDAHIRTPIHARSARNKTKYRLRHRRTHRGLCTAAVRAVTAAQLYLDGKAPNLTAAALCCGSSVAYARAAVILLKSENATMRERVLLGKAPILPVAKQLKQLADLVNAYRTAGAADRVAFAKAIGPTTLFDSALVPQFAD